MADIEMKENIEAATAASAANNLQAANSPSPTQEDVAENPTASSINTPAAALGTLQASSDAGTTGASSGDAVHVPCINVSKIGHLEEGAEVDIHKLLRNGLAVLGKIEHFSEDELHKFTNWVAGRL